MRALRRRNAGQRNRNAPRFQAHRNNDLGFRASFPEADKKSKSAQSADEKHDAGWQWDLRGALVVVIVGEVVGSKVTEAIAVGDIIA